MSDIDLIETSSVVSVECPDCQFLINLEGGEIGDYFECDTCACELVLKSLVPARVEVLVEEK